MPFTVTVSVVPGGSFDPAGPAITIGAAGKGDSAPTSGTLVNGVATFTATFSSTGYLMVNDGVHFAQAVVVVEPPQTLAATAPTTVAVGVPFTVDVTTNEVLGSASFTIKGSDGAGVLPASGTFVGNAASFAATLNTPGTQTITVADGAAMATVPITVVAPAQTLTVTAPSDGNEGGPLNVTVTAAPAGDGASDPLSIQVFDPGAKAPSAVTLVDGTATFQVTFRAEGLELICVSDTLNPKALGYALVQVETGGSTSPVDQYNLVVTYPSYVTLGAPCTLTLSSDPGGAGSGDMVEAAFPPVDPADANGAPVVSGTLASNGVFTGTGEYPATAAAISAVSARGQLSLPGSLQATGANAIAPVTAPVVVVPPAASLSIVFQPSPGSLKTSSVDYNPSTSLSGRSVQLQ